MRKEKGHVPDNGIKKTITWGASWMLGRVLVGQLVVVLGDWAIWKSHNPQGKTKPNCGNGKKEKGQHKDYYPAWETDERHKLNGTIHYVISYLFLLFSLSLFFIFLYYVSTKHIYFSFFFTYFHSPFIFIYFISLLCIKQSLNLRVELYTLWEG